MMKASKLLSIILAIALVFTLCAGVMAAEKGTITIGNAVERETYTIYKMFDLESYNTETNSFSYKVTEQWEDFVNGADIKDVYLKVNANKYVTWVDGEPKDDAKAAFAKKAKAYADKNKLTGESKTAISKTVEFTGLDLGYYLVDTTLGTLCSLNTTKPDATIEEKNIGNTITKQVKEEDANWVDENDVQVGETVYFKSTVTLSANTTNVVVTDTMDQGLTYNAGSVAIDGLTENTQYILAENATGFTITFKQEYLDSINAGTELTLTYTATLNEKAVKKEENGVAIVKQNNKIVLTYGKGQSVESTTTTTTHSFSVFKHAEGATKNLAGAVFSLKKGGEVVKLVKLDDKNYRVAKADETGVDTFTTVAAGDIVIWGVDADNDYTLDEKKAPAGYNKLAEAVSVTVNADNSTRVDVENNTGAELPSTGGMGTTLFYVLGAILVLGAAVILVVRRRMRAE